MGRCGNGAQNDYGQPLCAARARGSGDGMPSAMAEPTFLVLDIETIPDGELYTPAQSRLATLPGHVNRERLLW
jgi:hypothetical protein